MAGWHSISLSPSGLFLQVRTTGIPAPQGHSCMTARRGFRSDDRYRVPGREIRTSHRSRGCEYSFPALEVSDSGRSLQLGSMQTQRPGSPRKKE